MQKAYNTKDLTHECTQYIQSVNLKPGSVVGCGGRVYIVHWIHGANIIHVYLIVGF